MAKLFCYLKLYVTLKLSAEAANRLMVSLTASVELMEKMHEESLRKLEANGGRICGRSVATRNGGGQGAFRRSLR